MSLRNFLQVDDDHPFTGRHMLVVVFLFFGTIIAVNTVLAVAATGTFPGLVVENSYVASQHFNRVIDEGRAREAAGWQSAVDVADGVLGFRLADARGIRVGRLTVTAMVGRSSTTSEDRTVSFVADGDGYRSTSALPTGQWDIDVTAERDGAIVYQVRKRLYVPPAGAAGG